MRIADLVTDSRVGPIDRVFGFIFGVARGVLIGVVAVIFGQWLLGPNLPPWAAQSRSLPYLESLGDTLIAALPENLEEQVTNILQRGTGGTDDPIDAPIEEGAPPPPEDIPAQPAPVGI